MDLALAVLVRSGSVTPIYLSVDAIEDHADPDPGTAELTAWPAHRK